MSAVATRQLLTNIFEHICVTIISDLHFSHASESIVTERDLQVLERCNQDNVRALEEIVEVDRNGNETHEKRSLGTVAAISSSTIDRVGMLLTVSCMQSTFIFSKK